MYNNCNVYLDSKLKKTPVSEEDSGFKLWVRQYFS